MKIRWSPLFFEKLEAIGSYIAQNNPRTASRIMREIIESLERLEHFPKSGRIVPEFNDPEIREIIHPPYRILYELREEVIEIQTVIHGRQLLTEKELQ